MEITYFNSHKCRSESFLLYIHFTVTPNASENHFRSSDFLFVCFFNFAQTFVCLKDVFMRTTHAISIIFARFTIQSYFRLIASLCSLLHCARAHALDSAIYVPFSTIVLFTNFDPFFFVFAEISAAFIHFGHTVYRTSTPEVFGRMI